MNGLNQKGGNRPLDGCAVAEFVSLGAGKSDVVAHQGAFVGVTQERAPDLDLAKVKRWRNLWFLKDGSAHPGRCICNSFVECKEIGDTVFKDLASEIYDWVYFADQYAATLDELSHFIPTHAGDA